MIRDRLVIGIQDKNTKARLLREKDLSLDKALDMFKSSKITIKQLKLIQKDEKQNNEELNLVQDKGIPALGNKKKIKTCQAIFDQNWARGLSLVSRSRG